MHFFKMFVFTILLLLLVAVRMVARPLPPVRLNFGGQHAVANGQMFRAAAMQSFNGLVHQYRDTVLQPVVVVAGIAEPKRFTPAGYSPNIYEGFDAGQNAIFYEIWLPAGSYSLYTYHTGPQQVKAMLSAGKLIQIDTRPLTNARPGEGVRLDCHFTLRSLTRVGFYLVGDKPAISALECLKQGEPPHDLMVAENVM